MAQQQLEGKAYAFSPLAHAHTLTLTSPRSLRRNRSVSLRVRRQDERVCYFAASLADLQRVCRFGKLGDPLKMTSRGGLVFLVVSAGAASRVAAARFPRSTSAFALESARRKRERAQETLSTRTMK